MSTRDRILDGAAEVMRTRGLANTTTKEIAKAAGLSEAMLYKVFRDKVDLFLGVLSERLPRIAVLRDGPAGHLGRDTMPAGLRRLAAELLSFYLESFPIAASVFSDPQLLTRHRDALRERGTGPHTVVEGVAAYLAAEQQAGGVAPSARPDVLAELLVGACLHRAFLVRFAGETATPDHIRRFAADVVNALEPALNPCGTTCRCSQCRSVGWQDPSVLLRRELPVDQSAIRAVHDAAFGGGADAVEAQLVADLRADGDVIAALSIVAVLDGNVVGHVICSRASIAGRLSIGLGPLGVIPAHQRRGVGQALMHAVLAAADALDEAVVALLGDPAYYSRFGFVAGATLGILPPVPEWGPHFQVRPLNAWDDSLRGTFHYARAFDCLK